MKKFGLPVKSYLIGGVLQPMMLGVRLKVQVMHQWIVNGQMNSMINLKSVLTDSNISFTGSALWSVFGHFGDGWQDATVYTESHDEVGNTDDQHCETWS